MSVSMTWVRHKEIPTDEKIDKICDAIKNVLVNKNLKYGNSALKPLNIFSKNNSDNSILIRLDDKLSRIKNFNGDQFKTNDIVDIIGYLILLLVSYDVNIEDIEKLID